MFLPNVTDEMTTVLRCINCEKCQLSGNRAIMYELRMYCTLLIHLCKEHCTSIANATNNEKMSDIKCYEMKHLDIAAGTLNVGSPQFLIYEGSKEKFDCSLTLHCANPIMRHKLHTDFQIELLEWFRIVNMYYQALCHEASRMQHYNVQLSYFLLNFDFLWLRLSANKSCRVSVKPGALEFETIDEKDVDQNYQNYQNYQNNIDSNGLCLRHTTMGAFLKYMKQHKNTIDLDKQHVEIRHHYKKTQIALTFVLNIGSGFALIDLFTCPKDKDFGISSNNAQDTK